VNHSQLEDVNSSIRGGGGSHGV